MPWMELNVEEQRMKFVNAWLSGGWKMTDLCHEFGVSRKTGYKYLQRYRDSGLDGLKDKSRAPKKQTQAIDSKLIEIILDIRRKHPNWGAVTLLSILRKRHPRINDWPSPATAARILKRNGMVKRKARQRKQTGSPCDLQNASKPNDVWSVDFKGHFTVGNGKRCDPLTVTDSFSRFILDCRGVSSTNSANVRDAFQTIFSKYGLPNTIRSDNGVPFSSVWFAGLTPLAVWWLKLGIRLDRIEPAKPYQNGRHERMHYDLKKETALPARSTLEQQQRAFDSFRREYNYMRPHHALGVQPPSNFYHASERSYPEQLPEPEYPTHCEVHRVSDDGGFIRIKHRRVFISENLRGELIGLEPINERHYRIHFYAATIATLDAHRGLIQPYQNPRPYDLPEHQLEFQFAQ